MNVNKSVTPIRPIQSINTVIGSKKQDRKFHDKELLTFSLLSCPISVKVTVRVRLMGKITHKGRWYEKCVRNFCRKILI